MLASIQRWDSSEIGRNKTAIELHPLDDIEGRLGGFRFLHRDHPLAPDLIHRLGDELADRRIIVG